MKTIVISKHLIETLNHNDENIINAINLLNRNYNIILSYFPSDENMNKKHLNASPIKHNLQFKTVNFYEIAEKLSCNKVIDEKTPYLSDHPEEIKIASELHFNSIYILSRYGISQLNKLLPEISVYHSLLDAAESIINNGMNNIYCNEDQGAILLKRGELVAFPTETVYGLGGDVFNLKSVENIFNLKKRPLFNPLIAHVSTVDMLKRLTPSLNEKAEILIENFWPGPLTIVLEKHKDVPDIATGGNPTIAVRMPSHPVALNLIRKAGTPIAAPSANSFGKTSPTTAQHVIEQLGCSGYKIIDGGACRVGVESTVLSITDNNPVLLRPGGLPVEAIEKIIGPIVKNTKKSHLKNLESPGMLASHYAPETPLILKEGIPQDDDHPLHGHIFFRQTHIRNAGPTEILSPCGSLEEASINLYSAIIRLDNLNLDKIIAWTFPESGLGIAINDRLRKASINN